MTAKRIGVLGGTFNPVHLGHLLVAEAAREALALERVLFVPAGQPPHKLDDPLVDARHRAVMLHLALDGDPHFAVSRVDLDRPGPHYTVDMLRLLAEDAGPMAELTLVMGADSLAELPTWHRPADIVQQARLAVVRRPGSPIDLEALEREIPGLGERVTTVDMPLVGISATALRRRLAAGKGVRHRVPSAVAAYLEATGLYREDVSREDGPSTT